MNRILKYKESLLKFIRDRSCLFDKSNLPDEKIETTLLNRIKTSNMILPILFLTIMNSQNKKNNISIQGYYTASSIEFAELLFYFLEHKDEVLMNLNHNLYEKMLKYLILCTNRSIYQNLDSINRFLQPTNFTTIFINIMSIYNDNISYQNLLADIKLEYSETKPNKDLEKWYIKDNQALKQAFNTIKQIKRETFMNYINKKIGSLCEMALCMGWILGGGEPSELPKIRKISRYFTMIYKLARDFCTIDDDLKNAKNGVTWNYIINYGLQESYELFMHNKQKFIQETMMIDIYTTTIKEIIDCIEIKVDAIIDETSPDLKSTCSTL